jgi:phytoene synthase
VTPDQYCQQKAAQSGSSFYYSFLFLPPERRRAITALFAFCREVDDVVDECTDAGVARTKLAWWRNQVAAIYGSAPQHPVAQALVPVVKTFKLPQARLQDIIDGMEMDLTQRRYADFAALRLYCYRVASVVGLLSAEIFGYSNPETLKYAENLGMAFQLTNIIRDVGEDARRDRVYLPLDELARYNVTVADIMHARESDGFRHLMEFQIERALGYYRDAFQSLPAVDRKAQRPGLIMAAIYQTLLNEIRADGSKVLTRRTSLTPLRKLWIAWLTWVKN